MRQSMPPGQGPRSCTCTPANPRMDGPINRPTLRADSTHSRSPLRTRLEDHALDLVYQVVGDALGRAKLVDELPREIYRDAFRTMILRMSPDDVARLNGWRFHSDGIHLNSRGATIAAELIQSYLDARVLKRRRQGHGARSWTAANNQRIVQSDPQPLQRVADGGWCQVKLARGPGYATLGEHGFEYHEKVQIELR